MKRCLILVFVFGLAGLFIAGCGPSAEEIATLTAAAGQSITPSPTLTPTATPTPTPIPYAATLSILDEDGNPIAGAQIDLAGELQTTDENGLAAWNDLPGNSITFLISAPGYFPLEVTETVERGPNDLSATLILDPNGLLAVNACAPNEKLVYLDDFQDGIAQGWDVIEGSVSGWSVEGDPENPDDLVIAARQGAPWAWFGGRETYNFDNTVWRLRFKHVGSGNAHINYRFIEGESQVRRYVLALSQEIRLGRLDSANHLDVGKVGDMVWDQWHLLEYSYYDGTVSVYIDGKEGASWTDPNPWEGGTLNFEPYPEGDSVFYYDDLSVCELTAPFEPIPRPKTGYNLTVTLTDAEGNPLPGATLNIPEMGDFDEATQTTDASGAASWSDLPGESLNLLVHAPGHFALDEPLLLSKGDNEASFSLERDEFGKLPSELCRPEEVLAYAEDIQSGAMPGWGNLMQKIELKIPGYEIIPEPELEGNLILKVYGLGDNTHGDPVGYSQQAFGDSVLRFEAKGYSHLHYIVRWHMTEDGGSSYFAFIYGGSDAGGRMEKLISGNFVSIFNWSKNLNDNKWHTFEISSYQGENQIWIDGRMMGRWTDPEPFAEGYMSFEHDFWKGDAYAYYDNFAVCNLNAPFVSIFADE